MTARIDGRSAAPEVYRALAHLDDWIEDPSLPRPLLELVRMRVSQINGYAYCLDMHSKNAIALGVSTEALFVLNVSRDALFYSDREQAAFIWVEALTFGCRPGREGRSSFMMREVELSGYKS
jgi:AhpD family alkylhydroperoxidase